MGQDNYSNKISMRCDSQLEANEAISVLLSLNYCVRAPGYNWDEAHKELQTDNHLAGFFRFSASYLSVPYNLPLLKSLAAMRDEGWHLGELVRVGKNGSPAEIQRLAHGYLVTTYTDCPNGEEHAWTFDEAVKLTKEEIISHFTPTPKEAPESIQPEDMVKGEWYHAVYAPDNRVDVFQFRALNTTYIYADRGHCPKSRNHYFDASLYRNLGHWDWSIRPATPEEIDQASAAFGETEGEQELTELPEKWCIERTRENAQMVNEWANKIDPQCGRDGHYQTRDGYIHSHNVDLDNNDHQHMMNSPVRGYTEITTDQFRRLVLKEGVEPAKSAEQARAFAPDAPIVAFGIPGKIVAIHADPPDEDYIVSFDGHEGQCIIPVEYIKPTPFTCDQMLHFEAMTIEHPGCLFNGDTLVKLYDDYIVVSKEGHPTRWVPSERITGTRLPAGTALQLLIK